ncbi:MAG: FAD-binding oxidoreductase [Deltaproteobacteria bacterium]|nr:MAG: FAD-binding oxidoreductase [Deltaproteobacteria bacterium]
MASVDKEAIKQLKSKVRGEVLLPSDPGYDEARTIWNAMIDRRPGVIVRCAGAQDVVQAVRSAREHGLTLAVRGGGHNIAGNAVCDDGLMIDLTPMKSVRVDRARRTARMGPGVTLGEFDREAQAFGLATPLGINSTTGVAGLTLGGGFGWLSRRFGLTIDNLTSADVVTAAGELVKASAAENSDLFWAIRGGGGNFGVVTSFEFRLHEVGPEVLSGLIVHPLDAARDVLRFYRDFITSTPEEFVCWFVLRKAPPLPFLPVDWHGKEILGLAVCYSGKIDEGERVAKPLRTFGRPLADVIAPTPFTAWQTVLDPLLTPGMRNYWKSHDFRELSDGLIDVFVDHARRIPDPQTEIAFAQLGGAVSRVPLEATAYTHRDAQFVLNVHGRWEDPAKDAKCIGWARELFRAAAPFATGGVYVNFLTQDEPDRVRAAYGANYDRLVGLKKKYDPENLFRVNQNIRPSA